MPPHAVLAPGHVGPAVGPAGVKKRVVPPALAASRARREEILEYSAAVAAAPCVVVAHCSSPQLPTGAAVWSPITSVESETLMEQPIIVSQSVVDEVVVPSETKSVVVQASAVSVLHSGSGSVVRRWSGPMVMRGHGGISPRISMLGGKRI